MRTKIRTRNKLLADNLDDWGADSDFTANCYRLPENFAKITGGRYDSWITSCAENKKKQDNYLLSYPQLDRKCQSCPGPVYIHHMPNLVLLLKAFSMPALSKILNWGRFLISNDLTTDHLYYILEMTSNHPVYRQRRSITTSIHRYLTNMGIETNNTFAI